MSGRLRECQVLGLIATDRVDYLPQPVRHPTQADAPAVGEPWRTWLGLGFGLGLGLGLWLGLGLGLGLGIGLGLG